MCLLPSKTNVIYHIVLVWNVEKFFCHLYMAYEPLRTCLVFWLLP